MSSCKENYRFPARNIIPRYQHYRYRPEYIVPIYYDPPLYKRDENLEEIKNQIEQLEKQIREEKKEEKQEKKDSRIIYYILGGFLLLILINYLTFSTR